MMNAAARGTRTGELLNQSYALHEVIESERSYDIYRATDREGARSVRVRLLRPEFALQSDVVQRFLRGLRALSALHHPNVSRVLAVESDETGIPFVVEEHVEGESLARTIEHFPDGMPLGVAINVLVPVVDAIAAAHELGVVHGQLDRDHVLVQKLGGTSVPRVVCFGAEPASAAAGSQALDRTAPELRDGRRAPDMRSDVWALGALLYETLSGRAPDRGERRVPLEECAPHLPGELVDLVERCLSAVPSGRPERASHVRDVLAGMCGRMRPAQPAKPHAAPEVAATLAAAVAGPRRVPSPRPVAPALLQSDFAHCATMVAVPAPGASATHVDERAAHPELDDDAPDIELFAEPEDEAQDDDRQLQQAQDDDAPEITLEPVVASGPPPSIQKAAAVVTEAAPEPQAIEIKTMSDLAAAFGPIEGAERIGQADAPSSEQKPAGDAGKSDKTSQRGDSKRDAESRRKADPDRDARPGRKSQQVAKVRALSPAQVQSLRERTQRAERRSGRMIGAAFFFVFAALLMFAIPLLCDPTHLRAQSLLGPKLKLAAAAFAVLSLVALIRTWALQMKARPMLLGPVAFTLKVVTGTVCVLVASFFLPAGALGMAETAARSVLPWAASLFYLFLALYGIMGGVRKTAGNALVGAAIVLLYSGGFFGSYRVLSTSVLAAKDEHEKPDLEISEDRTVGGKIDKVKKLARGEHEPAQEAAEDRMAERGQVGASEAEDMRAIDDMNSSRKQRSAQFDGLSEKMNELIR